jgi:hypothetical protein
MPLMSEHIDDALDRLANGADANQRLTLESILRTGLHYMSDEQIAKMQVSLLKELVRMKVAEKGRKG